MTHNPALLQKLLLVGTARSRLTAGALPPELAAVVQPALDAPGTTPEKQLWLAAGAERLWARAGHGPPAAQAADSVPSAPEQMAPCPHAAETILKRLLAGTEPQALLREWLQLLNEHGARLPERFLPNMLELATQDEALRPAVRAALGKRGEWLSRLDMAWSWAGVAVDGPHLHESWENGAPSERVAALKAWRRLDPAAARAALQSCWASEPPDQRAAFLPCLGINLDADDEPFLEAALDDRRKGVRVVAQRLLARLPGSRLSQRMLVRVTPLLQVEKRFLRGARLNVSLPEACHAAMARDGIGENKYAELGEKAGWLADLLAAVDPSHWSTLFGLRPDECFTLAGDTDYRDALLLGWTAGLRLHLETAALPERLAWLAAWTSAWCSFDSTARHQKAAPLTVAWHALSPAVLHSALSGRVAQTGMPWRDTDVPLVELIERLADGSTRWPAPLSHAIAERLLYAFSSAPSQQWAFGAVLPRLAPVLDPAAVMAVAAGWPGVGDDPCRRQPQLDKFFHIVRLRHDMHLSFQEHA